ncbi:MAG: hypothetical protein ACR2L1_08285 [Pyrinomonadaceae bacterium]
MATQEEAKQAVEDSLNRIGQEFKINFQEFETETYTAGSYRAGKWTCKFSPGSVALEYWFSAFSSRKEEVKISYAADGDGAKLETDLRECLSRLRQFVNRKKGMF